MFIVEGLCPSREMSPRELGLWPAPPAPGTIPGQWQALVNRVLWRAPERLGAGRRGCPTSGAGNLDTRRQNTQWAPPSHPVTNYLKAISDLSVRAKSINLLKENTGVNPPDHRLSHGFLPATSSPRKKADKLDFMKIAGKVPLCFRRQLFRK